MRKTIYVLQVVTGWDFYVLFCMFIHLELILEKLINGNVPSKQCGNNFHRIQGHAINILPQMPVKCNRPQKTTKLNAERKMQRIYCINSIEDQPQNYSEKNSKLGSSELFPCYLHHQSSFGIWGPAYDHISCKNSTFKNFVRYMNWI